MWRIILILSMLLSFVPTTSSQENGRDYRLRKAPAQEYLDALPEIVANAPQDSISLLYDAIATDIPSHYPQMNGVDFQTLIEAEKLLDNWQIRAYWHQQAFLAWLNTQQPDLMKLARHENFVIGKNDYIAQIRVVDFNLDGHSEWIILVKADDYEQYLVVQKSTAGQYELVESPLPWFGCCFMYASSLSGGLKELLFEDVNGDGSLEWVLALGGYGANHTQIGELIIVSWRDNQLVNIAAQGNVFNETTGMNYLGPATGGLGIMPDYIQWHFGNTDEDIATEIEQEQTFTDNWGCTFIETRYFDWNASTGRYMFDHITRNFIESGGCYLREGQAKIWDNDWLNAIPYLEKSIAQYDLVNDTSADSQYARLRLALAYSMVGQETDAYGTLIELQTQTPANEFMGRLIDEVTSAYFAKPTAFSFCSAMYNHFFTDRDWAGIYFGVTKDVPTESNVAPSQSGCDIDHYIDDIFLTQPFPVTQTPPEYLATQVNIKTHKEFDINQDGQTEYLIWLGEYINPLFFIEDGDEYHISRPAIHMPDNHMRTNNYLLADGDTITLAFYYYEIYIQDGVGIDYVPDPYLSSYRCYPPVIREQFEHERGYYWLWKLDNDELVPVLEMVLCADVGIESLLSQSPEAISGWTTIRSGTSAIATPATYEWNADTEHYEVFDYTPLPADQLNPLPSTPSATTLFYNAQRTWNVGNHFLAIVQLKQAIELANDPEIDRDVVMNLHYWLAMFYELSGFENLALDEYVFVYENTDSETGWHMLAGLHLEIVE